jgi:nicotinate-nucleotide adenylyltransferase
MKVGLYFGSFNPIHHGHLIIAKHIQEHTDLNQIWFVVSPQNPLKPSNGLLNEYHRLHLVNLAIEDEPGFKATDIEFRLPKPSYTIDTLTYLKEKYPAHDFVVIMGSDSYQNLNKWKNYQQLVSNYHIIVYERPGHPVSAELPKGVQVLKAPMLEISATHIRQLIRQHRSIRFLVPDKVMAEIERNGYYK